MARAGWWSERTARVVAYHRQAGAGERGDSVPAQREWVRAFAKQHGIRIVGEFADNGEPRHSVSAQDGPTAT